MTTPRTIITQALKVSGVTGVGQIANADDVSDALFALNAMLGQWARKRWINFRLADVTVSMTGAAAYTVGVGGDVSIDRPDRIESAFARLRPSQNYPMDYPVEVIESREDWNRIRSKTMRGIPSAVFYDPSYPLGMLNVWPVASPGQAYDVHLSVKNGVTAFTNLDADYMMPPEYDAALLYGLAARLRPAYQLGPDPTVTALALDAMNTIRRTNAAIPLLSMPSGLPGTGGNQDWIAGLYSPGGDPTITQRGFQLDFSLLDGTDPTL